MGKRLMLVAGVAVGYVLGSRAGRQRYEQIARAAGKLWKSDKVQEQVHNVEDFAKGKAPEVIDFVTGNVKKVAGKGKKSSTDSSLTATPSSTDTFTATPSSTDTFTTTGSDTPASADGLKTTQNDPVI